VILADTSVWIDYLRAGGARMAERLDAGEIATHPFVIGEISLGSLRHRATIMDDLAQLPRVKAATDEEVASFVEMHTIYGRGVGWVDVHLLAAVRLTPGCTLWTRDRSLGAVAADLNVPAVD
jgi:predicted nucleic acid-binding protein